MYVGIIMVENLPTNVTCLNQPLNFFQCFNTPMHAENGRLPLALHLK